MSHRSTTRARLLVVVLAMLAMLLPVSTASGDEPLYSDTERFGVGVSPYVGYSISQYDLTGFRVGWYSDWRFDASPDRPGGIKYVQLVDVHEGSLLGNQVTIAAAAAANPGALWIIGNEPENEHRGNTTPEAYATVYNQAYTLIRGADPIARIAVGGVTEPTPLRLKWLERVLASYSTQFGVDMGSHIDVWTIHVQITPERRGDWGARIPVGLPDNVGETFGIVAGNFAPNADVRIFKRLVRDFCEWMVEQGERDKELIISEYGVLYPSDYLSGGDFAQGDQMVVDFMTESFDFLLSAKDSECGLAGDEGRLVQRWLWYSLNGVWYDEDPDTGFNGSLFEWDDPAQITVFGEAYRDYVFRPFKVYLPVTYKP